MVTASHSVPGSSSAERNNWTDQIHCCLVKKVTASHDPHVSSSTENKVMMDMAPPIVAKMATASQNTTNGSGSTKINMKTNMTPHTIVNMNTECHNKECRNNDNGTDKMRKRGFQHVYKSVTTNSSRRVNMAYIASVNNGAPKSKMALRRDRAKMKKIASLEKVSSSEVHSLGRQFLSTRPIFYSGTRSRSLPNPVLNGIMLSAIEDLKVIDTIQGARMLSKTGDMVFILIPRLDAIHKMTNVSKIIASLHALEKGKGKAEIRGKTRITVAEDDGKYATVGLKANRGTTGVSEIWPKTLSDVHRDSIRRLMRRCEEAAKGYLPSNELRGLRIAQLLGNWKEISGVSSSPIWGSLACGKNYYLNSHVDEDFFYSLTTVASERGLQADIEQYNINADVCNFFTFAEQGVAVALRPGDMLIFNPIYQHCLSSRTLNYEQDDVFCISLYLKTAVVGQNDNSVH